MRSVRENIGGLGNLLFKEAFIYAMFRRGQIPDIYVQNEIYFKEFKEELKQRWGENIGKEDKIAIHVRRGDYVDNPFYVDLFSTGYYERAMKEFPGVEFVVFSDDPTWCEMQPLFKGCEIDYGTEVESFNRMAGCVGHVTANSSFSYWAAYISPHGGKVIAPKEWYSDKVERTILPDEWIKI